MAIDAIAVLTEDHRAVNRALLQYEDLPPTATADRREIANEIMRRLAWHTATEQQFLYPLVEAAVPDGKAIIASEIDSHHRIATALRALAAYAVDSDGFDALVRELIVHVRQHMESEEQSLFPLLRNVVAQERLTKLGEAINAARAVEHIPPVDPTRRRPSSGAVL
jgi:hemerythrin-like domain-containing protein